MWFSLPYRLEKKTKKIRHGVGREGGYGAGNQLCILDGSIENFGGEVICCYIATNCNGITAGSRDFIHDGLRLLFVEATVRLRQRCTAPISTTVLRVRAGALLAHDDLCAFLGEEESRTSTDSLCERPRLDG